MDFIETSVFTRKLQELLTDEEYRRLQTILILQPNSGSVIRGSGGIRKIRWATQRRGKRGGVRVIYYWAIAFDQIMMLFMYAKKEQDDLTKEQLLTLAKIVKENYP